MAKADADTLTTKAEALSEAEPHSARKETAADREEDLDEDSELEEEEEEDEEEGDDEDEDEEEEEDVAASPPSKSLPVASPPAAQDPTWWLPHAVLATLVLIGVFGFFGAFNSIAPAFLKKPQASASAVAPAASATPSPTTPALSTQSMRVQKQASAARTVDPDPTFGARRIVVRYTGAKNSTVTRTKEQAKTRAEEALKKLTAGSKFEDVAGEFSDEASAKTTGGNLGNFKRGTYDAAIVKAVEQLEVGKTSAVFESPEGYEIVTRTK